MSTDRSRPPADLAGTLYDMALEGLTELLDRTASPPQEPDEDADSQHRFQPILGSELGTPPKRRPAAKSTQPPVPIPDPGDDREEDDPVRRGRERSGRHAENDPWAQGHGRRRHEEKPRRRRRGPAEPRRAPSFPMDLLGRAAANDELRDLVFELARLQTESLKVLHRLTQAHADFIVGQMRPGRSSSKPVPESSDPPSGVPAEKLLRLERQGSHFVGRFEVTNRTQHTERVYLPTVLALQKADGVDAVFVKPAFEPAEATLEPGDHRSFRVAVPASTIRERGTLLARASVGLGDSRALDLFIEIRT